MWPGTPATNTPHLRHPRDLRYEGCKTASRQACRRLAHYCAPDPTGAINARDRRRVHNHPSPASVLLDIIPSRLCKLLATGSTPHQRRDVHRRRCLRACPLLISNVHNLDYVKYHSGSISFSIATRIPGRGGASQAAALKSLRAPGSFGSSTLCAVLFCLGTFFTPAPAVIPSAALRNHCFRYAVFINGWWQCQGAKCGGCHLSAGGAGWELRFKPACRGAAALAFPLVPPRHGFAAIITGVTMHKTPAVASPGRSPMNVARCTSHSARKAAGLGFELPSFPFADSKTLRYAKGFWRSGHSGRTKPPGGRWRIHHRRGRALAARAAPVVFASRSRATQTTSAADSSTPFRSLAVYRLLDADCKQPRTAADGIANDGGEHHRAALWLPEGRLYKFIK